MPEIQFMILRLELEQTGCLLSSGQTESPNIYQIPKSTQPGQSIDCEASVLRPLNMTGIAEKSEILEFCIASNSS